MSRPISVLLILVFCISPSLCCISSPRPPTSYVEPYSYHTASVRVSAFDDDKLQNSGSGCLIGRSGNTYTVLTAAHVFRGEDRNCFIFTDYLRFPGRCIYLDRDKDLALIEFTAQLDFSTIPIAQVVIPGERVFFLGFPSDFKKQIIEGFIFPKTANYPNWPRPKSHASMPMAPGGSGGPLLNRSGQLVGIVTGSYFRHDTDRYHVWHHVVVVIPLPDIHLFLIESK
jgi:S1-C subfamily serine protease